MFLDLLNYYRDSNVLCRGNYKLIGKIEWNPYVKGENKSRKGKVWEIGTWRWGVYEEHQAEARQGGLEIRYSGRR